MTTTVEHRTERVAARRDDRAALITFGVVLAIAFVLFLVLGHDQWFYLDEWDFIAERSVSDLRGLVEPHNEHWSTLPILAYRALYRVFGLDTYVPYQVVSVSLHLTVAALLRVVMRRAGVGPWIATCAAGLFALFGAGSQDIVWAFQMAWGAALVLGLTHLLLADHDGPVDRRDWIGLAAGLLALMCSGVAVTMVVVVGLAVLVRRGWRIALLHTLPLALVYVVWWWTYARDSYEATDAAVGTIARFVGNGLDGTFDALGQLPGVGIVLGVVLVSGLVLAWRGVPLEELRRRAAAPSALLVGTLVFLTISGLGRAAGFGPSFARSGRYLHVVAALVVPALAVAANAFVRRWRVSAPIMVVLLLVGVPGNIDALAGFRLGERDVPGRVEVLFAVEQSNIVAEGSDCEAVRSTRRPLAKGESVLIKGDRVRVTDVEHADKVVDYVAYDPDEGNRLRARTRIELVFTLDEFGTRAEVCALGTD